MPAWADPCAAIDSARRFADTDCDGVKDTGELYLDEPKTDRCFSMVVEAIAITDEWEIELPAWAGTMTDFRCEALGGTSFTVNVCDGEDLGDDTCSTSILGGTLACTTTGANDNTLTATDFAASDSVSIVVSAVSGSVTWARMSMTCTRN